MLQQCLILREQTGLPELVCSVPPPPPAREGDLFGDEYFAVAVKDVLGTPFRRATAVTRTAPSELLVIPSR